MTDFEKVRGLTVDQLRDKLVEARRLAAEAEHEAEVAAVLLSKLEA